MSVPAPPDLNERFPCVTCSEFRGDTRLVVPRDDLVALFKFLRDEHHFDLLVDLTCVDYLKYRGAENRFGLIYIVGDSRSAARLTVRTFVNEPDTVVPSVTSLWRGANWLEREVWDLFGITFDGHPDHRRILLPEEFTAHPLRKDYPLQGLGERHNFPTITRGEA
ncbi:MAG: NADH-quinone oxidoreductase subunit C [Planctomycetales bacterium]|nr:NADH-quinone oxidoreductase subunit C [Planctomycetales bacterium]